MPEPRRAKGNGWPFGWRDCSLCHFWHSCHRFAITDIYFKQPNKVPYTHPLTLEVNIFRLCRSGVFFKSNYIPGMPIVLNENWTDLVRSAAWKWEMCEADLTCDQWWYFSPPNSNWEVLFIESSTGWEKNRKVPNHETSLLLYSFSHTQVLHISYIWGLQLQNSQLACLMVMLSGKSENGYPNKSDDAKLGKDIYLCKTAIPNRFGTKDRFCGRQFFHGLWGGGDLSFVHSPTAHLQLCGPVLHRPWTITSWGSLL